MKVKNYYTDDNGDDKDYLDKMQQMLDEDPDYQKWLDEREKENDTRQS